MDRRGVLRGVVVTVAVLAAGPLFADRAGACTALNAWTTQTLEAFADTLVPGERRYPGDLAIAGAAAGPGAVQAGVLQVLTDQALPLGPVLPQIASLLDTHALAWAATHWLWLPPTWPPFVGLPFEHRTALVEELFDRDDADRPVWQTLALVVGLAFDTAAHLDTATALATAHPGLAWLGFPAPDPDGLWRFPQHSYNRPLASLHPATTPSGSPA